MEVNRRYASSLDEKQKEIYFSFYFIQAFPLITLHIQWQNNIAIMFVKRADQQDELCNYNDISNSNIYCVLILLSNTL